MISASGHSRFGVLRIASTLAAMSDLSRLGDRSLLPGLIDAHTHLTYDREWLRPRLGKHPMTPPAERALVGARNASRTLRAGFTTVRDLGTCCFADVTLSRAVAEGLIEGPEIVPSGHVITTTGGDCDQTLSMPTVFDGGPEYGIADGPEAIAHAVRSQIRGGAKVIKTCADRGNFDAAELRIMADIAHRMDLKLAVHVWKPETVRAAVQAGADSIEHLADFDHDVLEEMATRGVFLVPTVHVTDGMPIDHLPPAVQAKIAKNRPMYHAAFRRAVEHGVRIAFGSDVGEFDNGKNALELAALVRWGLSPLATLRAATTEAAELLGFADRGRIETGLRADLVAIAGDPLEDMTAMQEVDFVMKAGQVIVRPRAPR